MECIFPFMGAETAIISQIFSFRSCEQEKSIPYHFETDPPLSFLKSVR
jgi:hypothetical protein